MSGAITTTELTRSPHLKNRTQDNTGTQKAHNTGSCTQGTHLTAVGDVRANLLHQVKDVLRQGSLGDLINAIPKHNKSRKQLLGTKKHRKSPSLPSPLLPTTHPLFSN